MNNSQALKDLKQSAQKQTDELKSFSKEIHQENWNKLSENLTDLTSKKLENLKTSTTEKHEKLLKALNSKHSKALAEMQENLNWNKRLIISLTAIISLAIGIAGTIYLKPYLIPTESNNWTVPKELRYQEESGRYILIEKNNPNLFEGQNKTTKYLKIGE